MHFMTGCQDGQIRIYDTCSPLAEPRILNLSSVGTSSSPMKVAWSTCEDSIAFVSTRSGIVQKWDTRINSGVPVMSAQLSPESSIADMELSPNLDMLSVAYGNKVCSAFTTIMRLLDIVMSNRYQFYPCRI
jgi:WD40 repeat protein